MNPLLQDQKHRNKKDLHVNFTNLNESNKQQFLDFLIQNNIIFQKCDDHNNGNYIAKVTITKNNEFKNPNKNNNNIHQQNILKPKNYHHQSNNKYKNNNKNKTPQKYNINNSHNNINIDYQQHQSYLDKQTNNCNKNQQIHKINYKNKTMKTINNNNKEYYHCSLGKSIKTTQFQTEEHSLCLSKKNNTKHKPPIKTHPPTPAQKSHSVKPPTPLRKTQNSNPHKQLFQKPSKPVPQQNAQKTTEINKKIRKKIELQKQLTMLITKLLKLFELKLQGQRPIKWSINQLIKSIQDIYDWVFGKNYLSIFKYHQHYTQTSSNGISNNNTNGFIKFIKQYFLSKYKNQKQAISNIISMIYSLSLYIQTQKKYTYQSQQLQKLSSTTIQIKIFENFLCNIYQFEDLLFYLFIRNIIINQIKLLQINRDKIQKQNNKITSINGIDILFDYKDIKKILTLILGQDQQLLKQYTLIILLHLKYHNPYQITQFQLESFVKISSQQFIVLLLQDYKKKRLKLQLECFDSNSHQKFINHDHCNANYDHNLQGLIKKGLGQGKDQQCKQGNKQIINFQDKNICETNQLTFGQQTLQNIQKLLLIHTNNDFDKQFWQSNYDNKQYDKYQQNSIEQKIFQKMKKKVKQFVNILIQNRSQYNSMIGKDYEKIKQQTKKQQLLWLQLLMRKSLSLLNTIIQMNKIQWFDDLKVNDPSQEDIDRVEELQLAYMKIKQSNQNDQMAKLCKTILTTPQLTTALEKLMSLQL